MAANVRPGRAQPFHSLDRRLEDTIKGTFPSGMRGPDDARFGVMEQHRLAIGGQGRQHLTRHGRHQRIGAARRPGFVCCIAERAVDDDDICRMNLMHTVQGPAHGFGHAGAVDLHRFGLIA